ncbi:hypothetical protein RH915_00615 [Serpentinicella sp. ANB-PHB4]|uniref:hypothetical protein n=1 Tax=Serpentinicella sp. ANB-PHB4 TaxID=3074076 RepID=UPI00285A2AF2|nr:hypothetical protein [Serpentinicella sp. ANB-PHB4]MDR5657980.1 hypothetical protein [Serpentinicella sp. ANB-PHB4]
MESILIFIAIAVITSLFNKDKKAPERKPLDKPTLDRDLTDIEPLQNEDIQSEYDIPDKTTRADYDKDISDDYNYVDYEVELNQEVIQRYEPNNTDIHQEYNQTTTIDTDLKDVIKEEVVKKQSNKKPSKVVDKNYVTKQRVKTFNVSRNALIQGIIMSEILDKPKSLKNK